jgi:hypothetical protein
MLHIPPSLLVDVILAYTLYREQDHDRLIVIA